MLNLIGLSFLVVLMLTKLPVTEAYTFTLESDLRTELYVTNSYQLLSRPAESINLTLNFMPISLNGLDIKEQTMSITGYYTFMWDDGRLDWSANPTYSAIDYIFSSSDFTWRPTLIVVNAVNDVSIINDEYNMMRISNQGIVLWSQMFQLTTACDCDITFYPFDTQTCSIIISTWSYTSNEVALQFFTDPVIMDFYSENGEWEYLSYDSSVYDEYRNTMPYNMAKLEFKFRRRPAFIVTNTIIPIICIAILSCLVFMVPLEQDKISYCLTVMLAYAVYLTMVADHMPTTSDNTSVLNLYNLLVLSLDILSIPITLYILKVYHKEDEIPRPKWLLSVTYTFGKLLNCMSCRKKEKKKTPVNVIHIDVGIEGEKEKTEKVPLTWKEIAKTWDRIFLRIYLFIITILTVIVMITLLAGYFSMYTG